MIQTMQSELFRIRKSRLFWACLVLAAFFVFALALTFYHNSVNGMLPVISLVSFTEFLFSDYSLIFPLTLFLCLYFTEDFHTGTYSITLSKGTSRVLVHGEGNYQITAAIEEAQTVITIKNASSSIQQEDIPHLFDRFYTTDQSRTKKTTGLGLAIAQRLVTRMGGQIVASLQNGIFAIQVVFPIVNS